MIVIGIPTYNEADNIARLTEQIDSAALKLGIPITFVNADSASDDGTTDVFLSVETHYPKVALRNTLKGKGRNIASILKWVSESPGVEGCLFIDGDVTSFEPTWLAKHNQRLLEGADYVVPTYSRNYQEGNTTNHFVYPLIGVHFDGNAPRQPISGDFGVSRHFAEHLMQQPWHDHTWGYGVDIFMTLHALYGSFNVVEVLLDRKVHKPSFDKMIPMFVEVAASYYMTTKLLSGLAVNNLQLTTAKEAPQLITTSAISPEKITERLAVARAIFEENKVHSCVPELERLFADTVDTNVWARVLIAHESQIEKNDSLVLARSILPWYLMRVVNYLRTNDTASSAASEIDRQFRAVVELWQHETLPH